jgi:hypothetical protein
VYKGLADQMQKGLAACMMQPNADIGAVAEAIVKVVDMPFGKRPFRQHIDPAQDESSEIVNSQCCCRSYPGGVFASDRN